MIAREATGSLRDAINLLEQVCDSYGKDASIEAVREGLGLVGDERARTLAQQALRGDLAGGLETIGSVRDDGLDLRQFQKEVVLRLRELLLVQSGADTENAWTPEQIADDAGRRRRRAGGDADTRAACLRAGGPARSTRCRRCRSSWRSPNRRWSRPLRSRRLCLPSPLAQRRGRRPRRSSGPRPNARHRRRAVRRRRPRSACRRTCAAT